MSSRSPSVVIVGAGFGGVGTAIHLLREGIHDITILERGARAGGVWNQNDYPGAACDVASHLYSFSFARNPKWGQRYAPQPEIQAYVEDTARRHGVLDKVRFETEVTDATWDDEAGRWRITFRDNPGGEADEHGGAAADDSPEQTVEADIFVTACGQLSRPQIPPLRNADTFVGPTFHSAQWRHDLDLTGLRVGVVGTGASAIQFVPEIQPKVKQLTVFQRTPPWIMPRFNARYRRPRGAARATTARLAWWSVMEVLIAGFVGHPRATAPLSALAKYNLARQVKDPSLRAKLTPDYQIGCKRILLSDAWYPALSAPNANVETEAIETVTETGLRTRDGRDHEFDVLIWGTGFHARQFVTPLAINGRGTTLGDAWSEVPNAWCGLTLPGFPNMFMVYGPNTYGGSGSAIYMLESASRHVAAAAVALRDRDARTIELRPDAHRAFMTDLRDRQSRTIWATGGCHSWYIDANGNDPTNWPGYTVDYRRRTAKIDDAVYAFEARRPAATPA